jgi:hypothetical protein
MFWAILIVLAVGSFFLMLGIFVSKMFNGLSLVEQQAHTQKELQENIRHDDGFEEPMVTRSSITTSSMCDSLNLDN